MEFFRFCPGCGRRFHVKLEGKKLVHLEKQVRRNLLGTSRGTSVGIGRGRVGGFTPTIVYEGAPVVVDVEEFQYNYKCNHCGHEWSDTHIEEHKEG